MSDSPRYADWKAPADDALMLVWPQAADLLRTARENVRWLAGLDQVRVQNVPLSKLRRLARKHIYHATDAPLIGAGHQTELYHPGVWAKDALANTISQKIGGAAYHFAINTDAPKHLHLRWPGGSEPITDD